MLYHENSGHLNLNTQLNDLKMAKDVFLIFNYLHQLQCMTGSL